MKYSVIPKLSEKIEEFDTIKDFITDKLEIQLLKDNIHDFTKITEAYLKKGIKTLIIHLPDTLSNWELMLMDDETKTEFTHYIKNLCDLSDKYSAELWVLGHLTLHYKQLQRIKFKEWFCFILRMVGEHNVNFLVENPTLEPYKTQQKEPFYMFVKDLNSPKVKCCFDLCHYRVHKFLLRDEYALPTDIGQYVKSIHFSTFPVKDKMFEKRIHGRKHKDANEILQDLELLRKLGINPEEVYLVTEINEEDYTNRPELIDELNYFRELNMI